MTTTMPRWCRSALVMTVVAGVTLGGTAGAAYALPRQYNRLINLINIDYDRALYWSRLAASAADDGSWDEYAQDWNLYVFYLQAATADMNTASRAHCL
jgi:hypothetical protein